MTIRCLQLSTESFSAYKFTAPLARHLQEKYGYSVALACNPADFPDAKSYAPELRKAGLVLHEVAIPREIAPGRDLFMLLRLVSLLRKERIQILHTHNSKAGVLGRIAGRLARVPVIIHTAYDFGPLLDSEGTRKGYLLLLMERLASLCADRILFIAEDGLETCVRLGIAPRSKLVNVGVGISFDEFNPMRVSRDEQDRLRHHFCLPDDCAIVGTLARLVPHKGIDTLLRAAALVLSAEPRVHFLVAGGGPQEAALRALAAQLGIQDNVTFTGFIEDQAVIPALFSLMDVFWLATRREGFGLVYTEANAMGVPVIGSNIAPVDHVIGDGGLLADPDSPRAFADACIHLLRSPDLRQKLAQRGYERSQRLFDERTTYDRIAEVYRQALIEKGQSPAHEPKMSELSQRDTRSRG